MRVLKCVSEKKGFATNSSSYHQVVFVPNGKTEYKVNKKGISKTRPIHIHTDEYGWGSYGACLTTWQEKACYVLTWWCQKIDYPIRVGQKLNDMKELRGFKQMLERHVGEGCIVLDGEVGKPDEFGPDDSWRGEIDHQSRDLLDGNSADTLEELIFSDSYIWIENDNEDTHEGHRWTNKREH